MPDGDAGAVDADAVARAVEAGTDQIAVPIELVVEREAAASVPQSLWAQVAQMGTAEKIKLALRGNKDARTILLRDPNKLIRRFVLQNPRITDGEVIAITRNRTADDELIRIIAERREWIRNYQVRLGLVTNPKTPLVIALKQVGTLGERDLRAIAKSRNVPSAVVAQARRLLLTQGKPAG